ncbi:sulfatase-like hydrolase/transferase [Tsuneonella sp. HG222]
MSTSRRDILRGTVGAALSASVSPSAATTADRPNILWLVSEDNNPFLGAYGDRMARTPNLDALASRGILFEHAYANFPVCAPSRFTLLTGVYASSCSPAQHMRAVARLPQALDIYPALMRNAGYYCTNADKTDYNCDVDPATIWDESSPRAHWRNRPQGKPFLAVFNSNTTHESRQFAKAPGADRFGSFEIPQYLPDTPELQADFANYYQLISLMDGEMGARLEDLANDGLAGDTIVCYYSDNGGALPRSKRYCYEEGLRVPLIVYVPPRWQHLSPFAARSVARSPVSLIDLPPTLLSIAGLKAPRSMQGRAFLGAHRQPPSRFAFGMRNRMDERYDFVRTVTDGRYRYIRNYMPHRKLGMRVDFEWLTKGYQSLERAHLAGELNDEQERFFRPKAFEELYDLDADPDQMDNLAGTSTHKAIQHRLRRVLDRHMLEMRDNGFIPEGSPLEGYETAQDPVAYPLRSIMVLAQSAARSADKKSGLFAKRLSHPNGAMRYWAATGLLIQREAARSHADALLNSALHDDWPSVRVVAAEALCNVGKTSEGLAVLGGIATDTTLEFPARLQSLNAIEELGTLALPLLAQLRPLAADANEYLSRAAGSAVAKLAGTYTPEQSFSRRPG